MTINNEWFNFRMDEATRTKLEHLSQKSGQPMAAVLRMLIHGISIREMPPIDYHKMNAALYHIGSNLNQIAKVANTTGRIDAQGFVRVAKKMAQVILEIETAIGLR